MCEILMWIARTEWVRRRSEVASQHRWNNVMREFVPRNEVHFVTQVTGIVCVCARAGAVKEGLLIPGLCESISDRFERSFGLSNRSRLLCQLRSIKRAAADEDARVPLSAASCGEPRSLRLSRNDAAQRSAVVVERIHNRGTRSKWARTMREWFISLDMEESASRLFSERKGASVRDHSPSLCLDSFESRIPIESNRINTTEWNCLNVNGIASFILERVSASTIGFPTNRDSNYPRLAFRSHERKKFLSRWNPSGISMASKKFRPPRTPITFERDHLETTGLSITLRALFTYYYRVIVSLIENLRFHSKSVRSGVDDRRHAADFYLRAFAILNIDCTIGSRRFGEPPVARLPLSSDNTFRSWFKSLGEMSLPSPPPFAVGILLLTTALDFRSGLRGRGP